MRPRALRIMKKVVPRRISDLPGFFKGVSTRRAKLTRWPDTSAAGYLPAAAYQADGSYRISTLATIPSFSRTRPMELSLSA